MTATKGSEPTISATKGKVLTARPAREVAEDITLDPMRPWTWEDRITAAIEADRSQQAAIHEEELREARELLSRWLRTAWSEEYELVNNSRAFLGASQQTGTPPADKTRNGHGKGCDAFAELSCSCGWADMLKAKVRPAGSGTAETCGRCKGLKKICWDDKRDDGQTFTHFEACPDCGGSGTTKGGTR